MIIPWLRRLFARRPTASTRGLFAYWDGEKERHIDPLVAWRAIWSHSACDFANDAKTALDPKGPDGQPLLPRAAVLDAEDKITGMTRDVFGVREWTEAAPGLTLDETNTLLARFLAFISELKKKRNSSQTPSPPTDSTEAQPLPASDPPPTSPPTSGEDCGCTATESSGAGHSGPSKPSGPS